MKDDVAHLGSLLIGAAHHAGGGVVLRQQHTHVRSRRHAALRVAGTKEYLLADDGKSQGETPTLRTCPRQ